MMKFGKPHYFLSIFFAFAIIINGLAQENIAPMQSNPFLNKTSYSYNHQLKNASVLPDTLSLPFVDDFSTTAPYPNPNNWSDSLAYINNRYPNNPLSTGVATLDIFNESGEIYPPNPASDYMSSDTLTSRPLDLDINVTGTDSIYLAFFYQVGGNIPGIRANPTDSLLIDIFNPEANNWSTIVGITADALTVDFTEQRIAIPEEYHAKGFKFRFRNIIKRTGEFYQFAPWHLDYVMVKSASPNEQLLPKEVAYNGQGDFLFTKEYTSIPWQHFPDANQELRKNNLQAEVVNNNLSGDVDIINPFYEIAEKLSGFQETGKIIFERFAISNAVDTVEFTAEHVINSSLNDSALLEVTYSMQGSEMEEDIESNNTFSISYPSYDFYAFDDGSAESVFHLFRREFWATKHKTFTEDVLKAIDVYITPQLDSIDQLTMNIYIWESLDGLPGDTIATLTGLSLSGLNTNYYPLNNGFKRFYIEEYSNAPTLSGEFFIGFQNTTFAGDVIGLGLDANSAPSNTYYLNDVTQWTKAGNVENALMVRPVFNKNLAPPLSTNSLPESSTSNILVYPNPASDIIYITGLPGTSYKTYLYDTAGRLLLQNNNQSTIPVQQYNPGIYILTIQTQGQVISQKVTISR